MSYKRQHPDPNALFAHMMETSRRFRLRSSRTGSISVARHCIKKNRQPEDCRFLIVSSIPLRAMPSPDQNAHFTEVMALRFCVQAASFEPSATGRSLP